MKLWFEKGAWASKKGKKIASGLTPESVQSILVIRHAAIGDMMVLRPFLIQARRFFPNAKITLSIVNTYEYGVPEDLVDHIHIVDKKIDGQKTSFIHRYKQIRALKEHDILFDMADTAVSGMVTFLARAKLKIGFPYRRIKNHLFFDATILRSDLIPEVETLLHFLYILGAPKQENLEYRYSLSDKKEKRAVYFLGASMAKKQWPIHLFVELIKTMATYYPHYEHVLLEGIGSHEKVDDLMLHFTSYSNVKKQEALSLDNTIPYLAASEVIISNDTGIRNMAIAAEVSTIGIFFFTVPYRYLPLPQKHIAVFNPDGSIPSVEQIFEASKKVLKQQDYQ